MSTFKIHMHPPAGSGATANFVETVEATSYKQEGNFVNFYKGSGTVFSVAALQVVTIRKEEE